MKIRVIDYIGNEGGGVRFSVELLRALAAIADARLEFVGHGASLATYRRLVGASGADCEFTDIAPSVQRDGWRFDVPGEALAACDVAWLPWVHRHRLPDGDVSHVIGSFHDAIMLAEPTVRRIFEPNIPDEWETTRRWLASNARVVVSSRATVATLRALFDVPAARLDVVPVSGAHTPADGAALPAEWRWADAPFILCPANISPHKNHEALIEGVGAWGAKHPLVLTGSGADLPSSRNFFKRQLRRALEAVGLLARSRAGELRRLARRSGLRAGRTLVPLGYLPDERYYSLLRRAWALIMPTLAEGGGSFPVEEALWLGIPVICSDIPVIREHMERIDARVLWFDPREPATLAARLAELEVNYEWHRRRAGEQVHTLRRRTWADAAQEYWTILTAVASPPVNR